MGPVSVTERDEEEDWNTAIFSRLINTTGNGEDSIGCNLHTTGPLDMIPGNTTDLFSVLSQKISEA